MKKLSLIAIATVATLATSSVFANNFAGAGIGVEASINSHDVKIANTTYQGDNETGANLVLSYGIAHQANLVSTVDAKVALGSTDIVDKNNDKIDQKQAYSVGYALGYTGLHDNFMPYAKVNYNAAKLEGQGNLSGKETLHGIGWGVGAKYKFTPNIEAGVEYIDSKIDRKDTELDGHNVNVGLTYRF